MNGRLNGLLPKLAAGLATAGIIAGVGAWGTQMAMGKDVETAKTQSQAALDVAHQNALAIATIVQWVETDEERTKREHEEVLAERKENREAHKGIMDKLDQIERKR